MALNEQNVNGLLELRLETYIKLVYVRQIVRQTQAFYLVNLNNGLLLMKML